METMTKGKGMTHLDEAALLPCPFCGGAASIHGSNMLNGWWVQCDECCATSPVCDECLYTDDAEAHNVPNAIAAWNTRQASAPAGDCHTAFEDAMEAEYGIRPTIVPEKEYGTFQAYWYGWQACWNLMASAKAPGEPEAYQKAREEMLDGWPEEASKAQPAAEVAANQPVRSTWKPMTEHPPEMEPVIAKTKHGTVGIAYVYRLGSEAPQWNFMSMGMNAMGLLNEEAVWMHLPK